MASTISSTTTTDTHSVTNTPRSAQITSRSHDDADHDDAAVSDEDTLASTSTTTIGHDDDIAMDQTPYQLKLTNMALLKEITQLKTDKEFVWSLWKRLQVANPNIAAAMDLVVAREREKAEAKDEKVLKILTIKDKQINDLEEKVRTMGEEVATKEEQRVDIVKQMEDIRRKEDGEEEKKVEEAIALKETIEKLKMEMKEVVEKLTAASEEQNRQAESSQAELRTLTRQNGRLMKEAETLKRTLEENHTAMEKHEKELLTLGDELKELGEKEAKTKANYQEAKKLLDAVNGQRQKDKDLIEHKGKELESVRQELINLWDKHKLEVDKSKNLQSIASQLQKLQSNTQNVIKNQEAVFNVDANNLKVNFESLKAEMKGKLESAGEERDRLKGENVALKEEVNRLTHASKDKEIQATMTSKKDQIGQVNEAVMECEWEMMQLKREQSAMRDKLEEKNKVIHEMESLKGIEGEENVPVNTIRSKKSSKKVVSVDEEVERLKAKLLQSQSVIEAKQNLIATVEKSHASRAKRMEELTKELEKKSAASKDELRRQDIAGLSEKMKEMIFLRNENHKIVKDNIDLRDEVDMLKVRLASRNDELKSHDLKVEEIEKSLASKIQGLEVQLKDHLNLVRSHEETKARLLASNDNLKAVQNKRSSIQAETEQLSLDLQRARVRLHEMQHSQQRSGQEISRLRLEASEGRKDVHRAKMLYEKERMRAEELSEKVDSLRVEMDSADERWRVLLVEKDRLLGEKDKIWEGCQQDESRPHESSVTEDPTTESDAETLKHLKDSFQSFAARNVVQSKTGRSEISTKKFKAVLRSRLANMKKLNASLKAETELWKQKCVHWQVAVEELTRRCENQEKQMAAESESDAKEAEKLSTDLKQLKLQEKERKRTNQEVSEQNETLKAEVNKLKSSFKEAELGKQILSKDLEIALEKLRSAEKDNQRKKTLMEEYKSKVKLSLAEKEAFNAASKEFEAKLVSSEEAVRSAKKTIESLKTKLRLSEEEHVEKEKEIEKLRDECQVNEKALKKANRRLKESDGSLTELEQVAKMEMQALVETSETKLAELLTQLSVMNNLREKLTDEIISFAHDANDIHRTRLQQQMKKRERPPTTESYQTTPTAEDQMLSDAKKTAKHILQLSEDDIEDIMSSLSPNLDSDRTRGISGPAPQTRGSVDEFSARSQAWLAAIQRAVETDDATALRSLRYLLKSKLQEIVALSSQVDRGEALME